MNFAIRYLTEYAYDGEVVDNLNALRVKPAAGARQRVDEFSVKLTPEARLHRHTDYFGTEVVEFEIARPHRRLAIDVRARVATRPYDAPPDSSWEALSDPAYREAGGEFLLQTDDPGSDPALDALLEQSGAASSPVQLVTLISHLICDRFEYRPGATFVDSPIAHLLAAGAGVCQDFVHLGLWLLRHHGVAARYVSGYLFATAGDHTSESVEVDTHAWLEALLPSDSDPARPDQDPIWVGVDPTNRMLASETHVKIGHGRHYADVPPIKGIYRGHAPATLTTSVTMTRLERTDPAAIARS